MKNKTARLFMLLASVLMLKICLGQSAFVSVIKYTNNATIQAEDSQKDIVLNITNTEFDEDENEENGTKDYFTELEYLNVLFHLFQTNNDGLQTDSCYHNFNNHISIYKANNCFRV